MTLNIKDREAQRLAQELAKETGETMTRAVTEALRERLKRIRQLRRATLLTQDLMAIDRKCAATMKSKLGVATSGTRPVQGHKGHAYDHRPCFERRAQPPRGVAQFHEVEQHEPDLDEAHDQNRDRRIGDVGTKSEAVSELPGQPGRQD